MAATFASFRRVFALLLFTWRIAAWSSSNYCHSSRYKNRALLLKHYSAPITSPFEARLDDEEDDDSDEEDDYYEGGEDANLGPEGNVKGPLDLTFENVDRVLEEMRPYLIADGGNVAIAEIDGPIVRLFTVGHTHKLWRSQGASWWVLLVQICSPPRPALSTLNSMRKKKKNERA